ncbi:MAG: hypothetical protein JJU11_00350 [Candidatus Sumerlaeia bacterium]|nr:hypothetical protein [Candidatus Sumerlaeia bacterium]
MSIIYNFLCQRGWIDTLGEQERSYIRRVSICLLLMWINVLFVVIGSPVTVLGYILGIITFHIGYISIMNTNEVHLFYLNKDQHPVLNKSLERLRIMVDLNCMMAYGVGGGILILIVGIYKPRFFR